jgi:hypothetical protein
MAGATVDEARGTNNPLTLCFALAEAACPIALFVGDLAIADYYVETLLTHSAKHALAVFHSRGLGAKGVLSAKQGDPAAGVQLIRASLHDSNKTGYHAFPMLLSFLAEALGAVGQVDGGLGAVEEALSRCERNGERWYIAELLRIKGELLLMQGAPAATAKAEDYFRQALDWARRQQALSWELRAAASLAGLWQAQRRVAEARALLEPIYGRFTEGFATADLQQAKRLLEQLT